MPSGNGVTSAIGDFGGAVADIFTGIGDNMAAGSYDKAASIARENAALEKQSTDIQDAKVNRTVYQTISGQQSDQASAGFGTGGSAGDLLRDSTEQGAMAKELVDLQGKINVNHYNQEATAYEGQAANARAAATGSFIGSAIKGIGAIAALAFL